MGTRTTSFAYDSFGYLDYMTTPDNRTFDYTYDIMGRLTGEDRPDGSLVSYGYDANGNVTAILNPNDITHGFTYTANDQRESYNTPISGSYVYQYDRDRRLKSVIYPSGQSITNTWANGQLQSTNTPEGLITYGYDCGGSTGSPLGGKLGSVSKGGESASYTYDGSLLLTDTRAGTVNALIDYTYNSDLQVDSIGYAGAYESFTYDDDGLLTGAGSYTITRNAANGLPEAVSDGTVTQGRSFSGYGEVDSVDYTVGAAAPYSWGVVRDNAGRITQKVESIDIDTITWDYTYDAMGRLETVYKDNNLAEAYSYDGQGNRLSETNTLRGVARSYSHNVEDHILTAGADTYNYDMDGFLTSRTIVSGAYSGTATFDYSSRGELLSATLPDSTVVFYDHDPMGRRISKSVNGIVLEKYLWQDATTLLAVYDGADNLIQRFEYADGRMPVSMTSGGQVYYMVYDQVGSLKVVTDAAGIEVKRIDYDSFGYILSDSNSSFSVPFGFAGGLHDRDTGLVRFGARDYDPAIGKWTAKDPIDFAGGDLNLINYSFNDPVNLRDSSGFAPLPEYENDYASIIEVRDWHYSRNNYNQTISYADAQKYWILMAPEASIYHRIGPGNKNNLKYISPDGHSEAVFRPTNGGGVLVIGPVNMGTYNFGAPTSFGGAIGHLFADMIPYYIWGNTPDEPTGILGRLTEPLRHGKEINPCDMDYMDNIL